MLGYFTSEQVGSNVLHYDPVPGRYDALRADRSGWQTQLDDLILLAARARTRAARRQGSALKRRPLR